MSKRGTWHGVLKKEAKKKGRKAGSKPPRAKRTPKAKAPSTALVPTPKGTVRVALNDKLVQRLREATLEMVRRAEAQEALATFDENVHVMKTWLAQEDSMTKGTRWALGKTLQQMLEKGFGEEHVEIVKKAAARMGVARSTLYNNLSFYTKYPTIGQVTRLEDAGLEWMAIRDLLQVDDAIVRDHIVQTVINEKIRREDAAFYVKKRMRDYRRLRNEAKPPKAPRKKAEAAIQDSDPTPLGFFRKLEQLLVLQWEPVRKHLERLGAIKVLMLEDKANPEGLFDESMVKLAECRKQVRIWNDNLAVITRLADTLVESNEAAE